MIISGTFIRSPLPNEAAFDTLAFAQDVMDHVQWTANGGTSSTPTGSIDRSAYPIFDFDCVTFNKQVPQRLPAYRWAPGRAHFEIGHREVGSAAPNPMSGTIGSLMQTFDVKIYAQSAAQAYQELTWYFLPALYSFQSSPPISDVHFDWAPEAVENNQRATLVLSFVAPMKVQPVPATEITVDEIDESEGVGPGAALVPLTSGSFRLRTIT